MFGAINLNYVYFIISLDHMNLKLNLKREGNLNPSHSQQFNANATKRFQSLERDCRPTGDHLKSSTKGFLAPQPGSFSGGSNLNAFLQTHVEHGCHFPRLVQSI